MIKIYYYGFKFWRAEVLRAALFLQNIPFENITDKDRLQAVKHKAPFGAFPIMELSDGQILSQTQAMASYVGKLGSVFDRSSEGEGDAAARYYPRLYPADDDYLGQSRCDEIINGCTDVSLTVGASMRVPGDEVRAKRIEMMDPATGRLYMHLAGLDSLLCRDRSGVACGRELTVADLAVWRLVAWLSGGILDHVPTDFVSSNFANLREVYARVQEDEGVIEYRKAYYHT
mmetsp:Transcript_15890/g.32977  ORF Transcript_15890/g.32977 Transcript_15890/m.32977 type:complete len:230 (+) Transcript_15890:265-954(+)|eukprot:CAMPEP_0168204592 /NCGR_PEP_ID=MMETSP0139_2-20121125/25476_1 /TAXON_ID=44445 /ORGANISM="Pseudo-nitzschia australis, Strain 10249 10 AB" /LENGTH=229 /DNA_ID=CAMNT_0008130533 /DNA_START=366 /DNA_END=1055 /DNA_ORIENTATION=+